MVTKETVLWLLRRAFKCGQWKESLLKSGQASITLPTRDEGRRNRGGAREATTGGRERERESRKVYEKRESVKERDVQAGNKGHY